MKNDQMQIKLKHISDFILVLMAGILIVRAFWSFDELDEGFYLAIVDRFWKGSRLVVDEWNPTQFFFQLLLPFYTLYRWLVEDGTGVYLFFRILAIVGDLGIAFWVYRNARKRVSNFAAIMMALFLLLYARANISGINYYNVFAKMLVLAGVCFYTHQIHTKKYLLIFCGISIALATCAMPYLLFADVLFGAILLISTQRTKFPTIFAGMLFVFIPYLILLRKSLESFPVFLNNFTMLFGDEEHSTGWLRMVGSAGKLTVKELTVPGMIWFVIGTIYVLKAKANSNRNWIAAGAAILSVIITAYRFQNVGRVSVIITALFFPFVISSWFLYRDNKNIQMGIQMYIAGCIAAFCFLLGSNVNVDAISTGCVLSSIGVIILVDCLFKEEPLFIGKIIIVCAACLIGICLTQRVIIVTNDSALSLTTCRIDRGPAKGLWVSEEKKEQYNAYLSVVELIEERDPEKGTIYLNKIPSWFYVASTYRCGVNSVWRVDTPGERFDAYFQVNNYDVPDILVVGDNLSEELPDVEKERHAVGNVICEEYAKRGYEYIKYDVAHVYILNKDE